MAKRGRPPKGGQMDLIDVGPENQDEILDHAQKHEDAMRQRLKFGKIEVEEKQKVLGLIHQAKLTKLEGGKIRVTCGDFVVTVTPRDELVQIEHPNANAESESPAAEKPTQGEPTPREKNRKKRTVKGMQETVEATEGQ